MMNYRCYCDVHTNYDRYGGAGVTVQESWRWDNPDGFENFIKDVGERPESCTLDRKNPYGDYEKDNCRWATRKEQQNNFRKEKNTKSGVLGVTPLSDGRFAAMISMEITNHVGITINVFDNIEDAIASREQALKWKMELGEEKALELIRENSNIQLNGKRPYNKKTSKYFGVSWSNERNCWRTQVWGRDSEGKLKSKYLGSYDDEDAAGKAVETYLREKEAAN